MQILAEWPRVESVTPTDYPALATFCCGTIESWERDVNRTFELLSRGEGLRNIVVRVAEHRGCPRRHPTFSLHRPLMLGWELDG